MPYWLPEPGNQGVPPGWQPQKARCHVCAPAPFQEIAVGVQSLSRVQLFETPWTATRQASLSFTTSWSLLKLKSIESVMPSSHPAISSSVALFSCLQSLSASESFPMSWLFTSGDQSIGASVSVLPMNIQG